MSVFIKVTEDIILNASRILNITKYEYEISIQFKDRNIINDPSSTYNKGFLCIKFKTITKCNLFFKFLENNLHTLDFTTFDILEMKYDT